MSTVVRTAYADLSRDLVAELAGAGLDPRAVYEHVVLAFEEDLPDGGVDVTSAAMPPMGRAVADVVARTRKQVYARRKNRNSVDDGITETV